MSPTRHASPLRAAYDRWHDPIGASDGQDAPWHRLVRRHLNEARDLAGQQVLEVGCGRGGFSRWLVTRRPARLVAFDLSEVAIAKARTAARDAGLPAIAWGVGDIQTLPFGDAMFGTVISCETIEHVPDPAGAVRELARVLAPGGRLWLTSPNYLGPLGLYRGYLRLLGRAYTEAGQPINRLTLLPRTRAWVRRAGLAVELIDGDGHYAPIPGRPPVAVAMLDRPRAIMRWFALHSLVVARKPLS